MHHWLSTSAQKLLISSCHACLQWNAWSDDKEGHDHKDTDYNKDEVASGVQNFLICIEMFFAALAHAYAFPPKDYMDPGWTPKSGLVYSLRIMFDVRDVVDDVEDVVNDTVSILDDSMRLQAALTHIGTVCSSQHKLLCSCANLKCKQ